jgi:ribonuclease HI
VKVTIYIDGASRGNPGPSSIGVRIESLDGKVLKQFGRVIGLATNNVAEYTALEEALLQAKGLGASDLDVRSDSELLVRQFNGRYRVKSPHLSRQLARIRQLGQTFLSVTLTHVRREQNREADRLANEALDAAGRSS